MSSEEQNNVVSPEEPVNEEPTPEAVNEEDSTSDEEVSRLAAKSVIDYALDATVSDQITKLHIRMVMDGLEPILNNEPLSAANVFKAALAAMSITRRMKDSSGVKLPGETKKEVILLALNKYVDGLPNTSESDKALMKLLVENEVSAAIDSLHEASKNSSCCIII